MKDIGTVDKPQKFVGEELQVDVFDGADPTDVGTRRWWYRGDLSVNGSDAVIRVNNNGEIVDVPVYENSTSVEAGIDTRFGVVAPGLSEPAFVPLTDPADAAFDFGRIETPSGTELSLHNRTAPGSAISDAIGSYENGDISAYGGNTGSFSVTDSPSVSVPDGSYVLDGSGNSISISTTDVSIGQGDTIRANVYIDSANEFSFLFGAQNENSWSSYTGYAVKGYENDSFTLRKLESGSSTVFGSSTWTTTKGEWLEIEVAWQSGGTVSAEVFDSADNSLGTVSGSDSMWSSGGFGWKEYGGRCYHDYIRTV